MKHVKEVAECLPSVIQKAIDEFPEFRFDISLEPRGDGFLVVKFLVWLWNEDYHRFIYKSDVLVIYVPDVEIALTSNNLRNLKSITTEKFQGKQDISDTGKKVIKQQLFDRVRSLFRECQK